MPGDLLAPVTDNPAPIAVSGDANSLMAIISRAASDPAFDVEKMERLIALYERVDARQAERQFNEAMQSAQADIRPVVRNRDNDQTSSKYATLEAISAIVDPIANKHGFSQSYGSDISPIEGHYRVTCRVSHAGGHSENYFVDIPADLVGIKGTPNKTKTHAFGSSMSYGHRYLKMLIWDVSTIDADDDGNAASRAEMSDEQIKLLNDLAERAQVDKIHFCEWLKAESFAALTPAQFKKAKQALEARIAKKEGANATGHH